MLEHRILEISYKHNLSHLSSCLTAVPIIDQIYKEKGVDDKFILSAGHAGLALYVVLEKYLGHNAEMLFNKHGVHPNHDEDFGIDASTGSLGQGLPLAVGMSIADKDRDVYCLLSDGECAEGSIWESLAIAHDLDLRNLIIYINANGYSAYRGVDRERLAKKLTAFAYPTNLIWTENPPLLEGIGGHYKKLDESLYNKLWEYYDEAN